MKVRVYFLFLVGSLASFPSFAQTSTEILQAQAAKGDAQAELDLGRAYHLGKGVPQDFAKAVEFYRQAAAQGNAKAMYNLGYIYQHGQGVPPDGAAAAQWFQKAADLGLPAAQLELGLFYFFGDEGLEKDYASAAKWLTLAARLENPPAQRGPASNALGYLYEHGWGVPLDGKQAISLYSKAAEMGNAKAQSNLGRVYYEGILLKRDPLQSYTWLKLAAFQGDPMATHLLSECLANEEFTAAEMAEGDRRAVDFQAKHHHAAIPPTWSLPAASISPESVTPAPAITPSIDSSSTNTSASLKSAISIAPSASTSSSGN
jgi:TPR repeat protein